MEPLANLGLWGDGDEVDAIEEAFRAIKSKVPKEDASNWITVADLWRSALRVAPELAESSEAWDRFRQGLSVNTYVDWRLVSPETRLLDGRGYTVLQRMIATAREWLSGVHA